MRNYLKTVGVISTGLLITSSSAFAALDPDLAAEFTAAKTTASELGVAALVVIVAVAAFKYARRAL